MIQKARTAPITREIVDQALFLIGRLTLRMEQVEAGMQSKINEIKAEHASELEGLRTRIESLAAALRLRVEDSRQDLLPKKAKMLKLLMGIVGFRKQPDRVTLAPGLVEKDALLAIHSQDLAEQYLRVVEEINKQAVATAVRDGRLDEAALAKLGLRARLGGDEFYYALDRDSVLARMREGH